MSLSSYCAEVEAAVRALPSESRTIEQALDWILAALRAGRKLLVCGNGGSAAGRQNFENALC